MYYVVAAILVTFQETYSTSWPTMKGESSSLHSLERQEHLS